MSKEYTLGPWRFVKNKDFETDCGSIVGSEHKDGDHFGPDSPGFVCDFGDEQQYYPSNGYAPEPADMALILSAPLLLEAAQAILAHDRRMIEEDIMRPFVELERLEEAIKAATTVGQ